MAKTLRKRREKPWKQKNPYPLSIGSPRQKAIYHPFLSSLALVKHKNISALNWTRIVEKTKTSFYFCLPRVTCRPTPQSGIKENEYDYEVREFLQHSRQ